MTGAVSATARQALVWLSQHGPAVLASGVLLGLAWPELAALARPWMSLTVFGFLLGSFLRLDLARTRQGLREWQLVLLPPLWLLLLLPLGQALLARSLGLEPALVLALALACAAPPSTANAALARMLKLDADAALLVTLLATALAPLSLPALLQLLGLIVGRQDLTLDPLQLAQRLAGLLGAAVLVALLWRRLAGARLAQQALAIDAGVLLCLLTFALATMAGVRDLLLADPARALLLMGLAFASNMGMQLLTAWAMPGPWTQRLTLGLTGGNRNVGLVWSVLGTALSPAMALYFACTQLPIYLLPRLQQSLLRRWRT